MGRRVFSLIPLLALACFACSDATEEDADNDESAILDRSAARGRGTISFAPTAAGAPDEVCVLPKHLSMADYKGGDEKMENELCSYVFYGTGPRDTAAPKKDVAICPKLSSTNPGTDVHELLPGKTREQTEASICSTDDRPTKHLAKFKQSMTCSYTPSILGYYHLSRLLNGAGDVKPAVVRTMDLGEHKKIVAEALTILARQADNSYPKISWLSFRNAEANPSGSRYKDAIYTQDLLQIYGGLQENARGEIKYSEINRRGADPNAAGPFTRTPGYAKLIDGRPLAQITGSTLATAAQDVTQMRDMSEMLVMDYLMSQQDRFGNIHAVEYYYFPKPAAQGQAQGSGYDKIKKEKVDEGAPKPAGAVLVKQMLLKDNDCGGPAKTNVVKNAGLIDQIRHMNAKTYANLRWLSANFTAGTEVPKFFVSEALFGQKDIDMLRTNLATLGPKLRDACVGGKLLLDLNLEDHLNGKRHDRALCDASSPPKSTAIDASAEIEEVEATQTPAEPEAPQQ
jgi:hypothetical protein